MKRKTVDEIVRHAIETCGLTRYQISQQSGVPESALSRFMSGERSFTLSTLDKLLDVLRLELREHK